MKKLIRYSLLLILFSYLLHLSGSYAQERGRLDDGRAFRVDREGNQIVDYIAELEVNIEGLNRRILGLENELEEKRNQIRRMNGGKPVRKDRNAVQETDLLGDSPRFAQASNDCSSEVAGLEQRLSQCVNFETARSLENDLAEARAKITQLNQQLDAAGSREVAIRESSINQEASSQSRKQVLERTLAEREASITALQGELESMRVAFKKSEAESAELRAAMKKGQVRASMKSASSQTGSDSEIDKYRASLTKRAQVVRGLEMKRNQLFAKYNKRGGSLKLQPQRVSSRLMALEKSIPTASPGQLRSIKSEIEKLRSKVKDDISLISRMK